MNTLLQKNVNYNITSEEKKLAKRLHTRGLKPEIFRAASDAHATNRLRQGYRHSCFNSVICAAPRPGLKIIFSHDT